MGILFLSSLVLKEYLKDKINFSPIPITELILVPIKSNKVQSYEGKAQIFTTPISLEIATTSK